MNVLNNLRIIVLVTLVARTGDLFAQCGTTDPIATTNYCVDQTAAWDITNSSPSNTSYHWYRYDAGTASYQKAGVGDHYETAQTFPNGYGVVNTYYYEKEIRKTPAPVLPATPPPAGGNTGGPMILNYSSTSDFTLNYVTVAITAYDLGNTGTFGLKVSANGQYSQWFTFKYSSTSVVAVSGNTVYVRVPVFQSASQLGLPISAGNSTISVSTCSGADPCPTGVNAVNGFTYIPTATSGMSGTYPLGPEMNLNYTSSIQNVWGANVYPGIFNVDVTTRCGKTQVSAIQETDNTKCCTPVASYSTITSSTGTNIMDTIFPSGVTLTAAGNNPGLYYAWYKDGVPMGASYQGVGLTTIPVSDYGIYSVKVVQNASYVNRAVCYKMTPFEAQKRQLFAIANPQTICLGDEADLVAKGATAHVSWTTATAAPITNANNQVASTKPAALGKYLYTVEAEVPVGNLVVNGDFEKGNVGFASTYLYRDPSTATEPEVEDQYSMEGYPTRKIMNLGNGAYTINDYVFWPGWNSWKPCRGRGGIGKFLYTDAATTAGSYVWEQTVNVVAGKTYEFSAWITNIDTNAVINPSNNPLPQANIYIDGMPLFSPYIPINATTCLWQKISQTWTATTTGPITLRVDEVSKENNGNDFAIDDITFGTPGTQTDTVSVLVENCVLPVVFLSYGVTKVSEGARIDWRTAMEHNAALFIVQRSPDGGKTFYDLGIVPAQQSITGASYSFIDETAVSDIVYYRIKEVDVDGKSMYSNWFEYQPDADDRIDIFPNPSAASFQIVTANKQISEIRIYDMSGRLAESLTSDNTPVLSFGKNLSPGIYLVSVYTAAGIKHYKVSKQ
jgi:hypothetical protein